MRRVRLITVCDACLRACCWHGVMMCSESATAGTVQKTARELRKLDREHPDYYSKREVERQCGASDYATPSSSGRTLADANQKPPSTESPR